MNAVSSAVSSMPYWFDEVFAKLVILESQVQELRSATLAPHPAEPEGAK